MTPCRIKANLDIVPLDSKDMAKLEAYSDELTRTGKLERFVYPPFGINLGFPDKQ